MFRITYDKNPNLTVDQKLQSLCNNINLALSGITVTDEAEQLMTSRAIESEDNRSDE